MVILSQQCRYVEQADDLTCAWGQEISFLV